MSDSRKADASQNAKGMPRTMTRRKMSLFPAHRMNTLGSFKAEDITALNDARSMGVSESSIVEKQDVLLELEDEVMSSNPVIVEIMNSDVNVTLMDYSADRMEVEQIYSSGHLSLRNGIPSWATVRWINIDGIHEGFIKALCSQYRVHPLALSDILDTSCRPKMELFEAEGQVFVLAQMVSLIDESLTIDLEQVSFLLDSEHNTLITIQEGKPGDVWIEVRKKLAKASTKIRNSKGKMPTN
eukprot:TRINITY_DN5758_c0_g1_i3.p1 TRINITY_DN5758_c0_g1~~TRINITY_DN5758_c0_g1_i3.p1  ORF type:complete len:241 (-),score=45.90 TRINITY_DN5758_c0_g1_i3:941-1663(-)